MRYEHHERNDAQRQDSARYVQGRGRTDRDGNEVEHRISCRCHWCDWRWYEPGPIYACPCGARARVNCDHEHAYLTEVTP